MNTATAMKEFDRKSSVNGSSPKGSRLQSELAVRILRKLKDEEYGPGYHLVELDLCREFDVSRTPVRGALKLLADQGILEQRANRGYVLVDKIRQVPEVDLVDPAEEEQRRLFVEIAKARNSGRLPDQCSQQEIVRVLDAKVASVSQVMRQLADLGMVERRPGNGWSFPAINSSAARAESFSFRRLIEPAGILEDTFQLDADWLEKSRASHLAFRKRKWRDTLALELFEINADFHEQIARCSGNRYMLDAVQRQNRLRSFLNIQWVNGPDRVIDSIDEHLEIMDSLASGDNKIAARLMKEHLSTAQNVTPTVMT